MGYDMYVYFHKKGTPVTNWKWEVFKDKDGKEIGCWESSANGTPALYLSSSPIYTLAQEGLLEYTEDINEMNKFDHYNHDITPPDGIGYKYLAVDEVKDIISKYNEWADRDDKTLADLKAKFKKLEDVVLDDEVKQGVLKKTLMDIIYEEDSEYDYDSENASISALEKAVASDNKEKMMRAAVSKMKDLKRSIKYAESERDPDSDDYDWIDDYRRHAKMWEDEVLVPLTKLNENGENYDLIYCIL